MYFRTIYPVLVTHSAPRTTYQSQDPEHDRCRSPLLRAQAALTDEDKRESRPPTREGQVVQEVQALQALQEVQEVQPARERPPARERGSPQLAGCSADEFDDDDFGFDSDTQREIEAAIAQAQANFASTRPLVLTHVEGVYGNIGDRLTEI